MSGTDFHSLMEPVARHLWGEPSQRTATGFRWGSGGSKSVDLTKGAWFDHEAHEGGNVIELVQFVEKLDKAGAVAWMESNGFIPKRENSPEIAKDGRKPVPATQEPPRTESPPASKSEREVEVEHYDYTDRDGAFQYRVIRYQFQDESGAWVINPKTGTPKKTFKQKSRDASGTITWGLNGREPCLYRWPEIEQAAERGDLVAIVEGEKDVHTLEAFGIAATTNSGGAQNWRPEFNQSFKGVRVVILIDNDDAGRERGKVISEQLSGIAASVKVIDLSRYWAGAPEKSDVTDWVQAGGTKEQLLDIIEGRARPLPPVSRFGAVSVAEASKSAAKHEWLVQDLIELHGTAAFSGYSQSGKSFQMIELAFAVALGRKFWGRDVKQGLVIYQIGEGEEGLGKRVEGYLKDRGIEDPASVPLVFLPRKINLFQSDDDATNLIAEAKAWEEYYGIPLRMIVIDTYNKATRGANEISGQDIGKINERLERIQRECHCNVTVVDHLSKGGTVRGHGSKTDDVSNMIRVEKDEKKVDRNGRPIRRMRLDKNKDGENGGVIEFVLRQVVVGFKEDGKPITTCVVEAPHGSEEELERSGRLPLNQSIILQTIRDVIAREGHPPPPGMPEDIRRNVVAWKSVMAELRRKWLYKAPETEPEQREIELQRIVTDAGRKLQNNGYIDRDNTKGIVWWTGKTDRPIPKPRPAEPEQPPSPALREFASQDVPF